jgi:opacity protein-like surface antigen
MKAICTLMVAFCMNGVAAAAEPPAWYMAGHLGANKLDDWPATVDFGGVKANGQLGLERGGHAGLMVGRETEHARFELEFVHGRLKVDTIELSGVSEHSGAHGKYDAVLANLYRHDALGGGLRAFAAIGLGWGRAQLPQLRFSSGCECLGPASRNGAAYQGRVGLAYQPAPGHAFSVQYSHLSLVGPRRGGMPSVEYGRRSFGAFSAAYTHYF